MKNIITLLSIFVIIIGVSHAAGENIVVLSRCINKTYNEMLKEFGAPADKTGYTIKNAPTKGWNHSELFSMYPKTEENKDILIMEVTWSSSNTVTLACFHMVNGTNRCLVAKRMKKGIQH